MLEHVLTTGEATWSEDLLLLVIHGSGGATALARQLLTVQETKCRGATAWTARKRLARVDASRQSVKELRTGDGVRAPRRPVCGSQPLAPSDSSQPRQHGRLAILISTVAN